MEEYMENCEFCKIVKGDGHVQRVWEDDLFIGFMAKTPAAKGHVLLIPKKHIEHVFELPRNEYDALFDLAKKLEVPIRESMGSKRVALAVDGFQVAHMHLHLIPVNHSGDMDSTKAHSVPEQELEEAAHEVREAITKYEN